MHDQSRPGIPRSKKKRFFYRLIPEKTRVRIPVFGFQNRFSYKLSDGQTGKRERAINFIAIKKNKDPGNKSDLFPEIGKGLFSEQCARVRFPIWGHIIRKRYRYFTFCPGTSKSRRISVCRTGYYYLFIRVGAVHQCPGLCQLVFPPILPPP